MSTGSGIEWTDATWNCLAGCTAVSPGCANCYAATTTRRLEAIGQADYAGLTTDKHFNGKVRCLPHKLGIPLKRRKPTMYFVNSMSDLFHEDVPDEFIDKVFAVMALADWHTFQVLTKRPARMANYISGHRYGEWCDIARMMECEKSSRAAGYPLRNVWLGVSAEDQQRADERIPWLLKTPAVVRFVSAEPLLGPINFGAHLSTSDEFAATWPDRRLHWVIDGCESGPRRREYRVEWSRAIQEQCAAAVVAYFRKQTIVEGRVSHDPAEWQEDLRVRQFPTT